jgi:hypothetical protein
MKMIPREQRDKIAAAMRRNHAERKARGVRT